jgi:GTP1/Obg family GTP-binding protein
VIHYIAWSNIDNMSENVYECHSCLYKTSRRTNANRHIRLIHNGNAIALNKKTGKLSSQKPITNHKSEVNWETQIIYDIFKDIITSFERLESLAKFFPEQMRVNFLSETLIASLLTNEPHKVINEKIKTLQNDLQ